MLNALLRGAAVGAAWFVVLYGMEKLEHRAQERRNA